MKISFLLPLYPVPDYYIIILFFIFFGGGVGGLEAFKGLNDAPPPKKKQNPDLRQFKFSGTLVFAHVVGSNPPRLQSAYILKQLILYMVFI